MVKQQKFEPEYAKILIHIALKDLDSAYALAQSEKKIRIENVFLLAQQALEKSLKAVLCFHQKEIPFIHDIGSLVTLVSQISSPPFSYDLNMLTEFATVRRYMEGYEYYETEELNQILSQVQNAILWCQTQIK